MRNEFYTMDVINAPTLHLVNGTAQTNSSNTPCSPLTLTVAEACNLLHVSKPTMYMLTKQADFPCFHIGRKIIISYNGLMNWIDQQSSMEVEHHA